MLTTRELTRYACYGEGFLYSRLAPEVPMAAIITEQHSLPKTLGVATRQCRAILLNTDVEEHLEDKREYGILSAVRPAHTVPVSFRALEALGYTVNPETWRVADFLHAAQLDKTMYGYELLFLRSLTSSVAAFLIDAGVDRIIIVYKSPRLGLPGRVLGPGTYLIKPAVCAETVEELLTSIVQEAKDTGLPPSEAVASYGFILFDTSSFLYMLSDRALAPDEVPSRRWSTKIYAPYEPWGKKYAVAVALGQIVPLGNKRILAYLPMLDVRRRDDRGSWYEVIPPNVSGLYMVMWSQQTGIYPPHPLATLEE